MVLKCATDLAAHGAKIERQRFGNEAANDSGSRTLRTHLGSLAMEHNLQRIRFHGFVQMVDHPLAAVRLVPVLARVGVPLDEANERFLTVGLTGQVAEEVYRLGNTQANDLEVRTAVGHQAPIFGPAR